MPHYSSPWLLILRFKLSYLNIHKWACQMCEVVVRKKILQFFSASACLIMLPIIIFTLWWVESCFGKWGLEVSNWCHLYVGREIDVRKCGTCWEGNMPGSVTFFGYHRLIMRCMLSPFLSSGHRVMCWAGTTKCKSWTFWSYGAWWDQWIH